MTFIFILLGLGLAAMALGGDAFPSGSTSKEVLKEPPDATIEKALFLIELETADEGATRWRVLGGPPERAELGTSTAPSREQALAEAYEIIERERGKLPAPIVRHGLRVAADCTSLTVQDLGAWLAWAEPQIDRIADELAKANRLSGASLLRAVWAQGFPECVNATPRVRATTWAQVSRRLSKLVDKAKAGAFIDVHPIGRVLAARMVAMSPPKLAGQAFFYNDPQNVTWAVVVDAYNSKWRWRVWPGQRDGAPRETGATNDEKSAVKAAKDFVDGVAGVGVDVGP